MYGSVKTLNGLKKEVVRFWKEREGEGYTFPVGRIPRGFAHAPKSMIQANEHARNSDSMPFPSTITIDGKRYRRVVETWGTSEKPPTVEQALISLYWNGGDRGIPLFEPGMYYRLFRLKDPEVQMGYREHRLKDMWRVALYKRWDQSHHRSMNRDISGRGNPRRRR